MIVNTKAPKDENEALELEIVFFRKLLARTCLFIPIEDEERAKEIDRLSNELKKLYSKKNIKYQVFQKQSFVAFEKFTKDYISAVEIQYGQESEDFIKNMFTAKIKTDLYTKFIENQTVTKTFERPTFLDWLLRRKRKYMFNVKVSEVTKYVPNGDNVLMVEIE